ncbi:RHS repeat-associated core domain-containing protein [Aquimarina sp. BL5]|uniref:RHS repeat domain-containing protein n=1 Tax=Aquimarina sp. BL5 TaxID=1714860 RepID=UPI000E4DA492|nr:RHS repeat-associated core domain-containing protein [Aquimarina sp. BL5]AXT52108.1 RHS repeat-associated core domain-containing protein [Aquimarina sp. BL5]RKN10764.1 RHS repeat-associated core domain-containing protein [Aquimarina sp. BL5]
MKNLHIYIAFCLVMVVIGTTKAQNLNWYQNTGFNVINTNTVSGNGNLLSFEVLSEEQSTGYFEVTNFKVNGNNLAGFLETKFTVASIYFSRTTQTSLNNTNQYILKIDHNGDSGLVGNRYTIFAYNTDGTEIGRLENIALQTSDRVRIEKTSNSQLRFLYNTQVIGTVTNPNLSWYRAGVSGYILADNSTTSVLSLTYSQQGFEITDDSYGPFSVTDTDKNWVSVNSYGITENIIGNFKGASVSYYDDLGKGTQSQTFDPKEKKTWASEVRYDHQGRPALSTLSAPIGNDGAFTYKEGFIKKLGNADFDISDYEKSDIENPTPVTAEANTLGWYYSESNNRDPYQDVTDRPYSRTIYSELNPGTSLKTIGGNKMADEWKNGYVFSMPAGQELSKTGAFGDSKYDDYKIVKTVSRDVHGIEAVVFTDTDGKTLAAARSGNEEGGTSLRPSYVTIGEQGFVDIHLPVGTSGISISGNSGISLEVFDLITEQITTTSWGDLPSGFYRIAVSDIDTYSFNENAPITITYKENYYDYSLNEYDKAGRLLSSKQPLQHLESTFEYNTLGQLTQTHSPDEGDAWFLYREDGQIRFSINSKQWENKEFSYTNYDHLGRPIESGVYKDNSLAYLQAAIPIDQVVKTTDPFKTALKNLIDTPDGDGLADNNCTEIHKTTYDYLQNGDINALPIGYKNPSFLSTNVAKTENENTTTYYSYDIYGRVQWVVQNIASLGIKTIDYEYDPITSQVNRVVYQKEEGDQFIHRYTYDDIDYSLTKVETSVDGTNYTEHAAYEYNETGTLKRLNLAQGLQEIDYVYNLNGALKSINQLELNDTNKDIFGMNIHYYKDDYTRTNTPAPVKTITEGINQYNGNIKAITWNTRREENLTTPGSYYYKYNKNNWLTGASFDTPISDGDPTVAPTAIRELPQTTTENIEVSQLVTLRDGFSITATSSLSFSAKIIEAGNAVDASGDYNVSNITYDANGNIQSLDRNKDEYQGSNTMDKLSYTYKTEKPNQLLRVDDAVTTATNADDIKDQATNDNYRYNDIGQLVENKEEKITYIYNATGLVTQVAYNGTPVVKFFYNDKNHRVKKESYDSGSGNLSYTEHYVRDAAGTALAIYRDGEASEHTIYGASRLGVYKRGTGSSLYQLTDHLGNVRAVIGRMSTGQVMALTSATDYYPFGMPMPNRNDVGDYRYAYQGQEVDPETGKEAFQLRLWDSRIGRWLTTDPAGQYASPYLAMGNNPISQIDLDGGFANPVYGSDGTRIGTTSEGDTGVPIIYDGDNLDFSSLTKDQLITKGGEYFNFQLDSHSQALMFNDILGGTQYWINSFTDELTGETFSHAGQYWADTYYQSDLRGGSISVNKGNGDIFNKPASSFTNFTTTTNGISYKITTYNSLSGYTPTVENIRATVIIHEGLVHGKWNLGDIELSHRTAYQAVINSNLWNGTTNSYKTTVRNQYQNYLGTERFMLGLDEQVNPVIINGY